MHDIAINYILTVACSRGSFSSSRKALVSYYASATLVLQYNVDLNVKLLVSDLVHCSRDGEAPCY